MVIISWATLRDFYQTHSDAKPALEEWYDVVDEADWSNFNDMKQTFNSVDYVGNNRFVFNIKGNRYRLVALIFFKSRTVFIRFVGTHAEYDQVNVSKI